MGRVVLYEMEVDHRIEKHNKNIFEENTHCVFYHFIQEIKRFRLTPNEGRVSFYSMFKYYIKITTP